MLEFVLNFLFPPVCGICGKKDKKWLCGECWSRLEKIEKNKYIIRLKENSTNLEKIYFDEFFYMFEYKKIIRKLLLRYKFGEKPYLSNLQMLLQPLEKEFNLPSVVIEFSNRFRTDVQCVSKENELSFVLFIPIDDSSDFIRILAHGQLTIHISCCI